LPVLKKRTARPEILGKETSFAPQFAFHHLYTGFYASTFDITLECFIVVLLHFYFRGYILYFDNAAKTFRRIDILINNAGIAREKSVIEMTAEAWDRVMDVNLRGHVFCTKAVGKYMIENRYGKVINISSILGLVGVAYNSPYSASKAGLIQFTKSLALEWARYNIQVNALCPGYLLTDLNREFFETPRGQKVINKIPMRRAADLREIRGVTLLLASDASSFMTGSVVVVDGGHTIG